MNQTIHFCPYEDCRNTDENELTNEQQNLKDFDKWYGHCRKCDRNFEINWQDHIRQLHFMEADNDWEITEGFWMPENGGKHFETTKGVLKKTVFSEQELENLLQEISENYPLEFKLVSYCDLPLKEFALKEMASKAGLKIETHHEPLI